MMIKNRVLIKIPKGIKWVIGVDEAGRGPLAGPVALAALAIRVGDLWELEKDPLKDSKQLSEAARERKFNFLKKLKGKKIVRYSSALVGEKFIDRDGIVSAVKRGIRRTLSRLALKAEASLVLLDGGIRAPRGYGHQRTIIKGDARVPVIAHASVIAKIRRDRKMKKLSLVFPRYDFHIHKGYGTAMHIKKIKKHGLSPIHRRSFVKNISTI